jgi:hypothetical protein
MTLKEKLCEPFGGLKTETANELIEIVDDFAIGFTEWKDENCFTQGDGFYNRNYKDEALLLKELLEIYKKEKGYIYEDKSNKAV